MADIERIYTIPLSDARKVPRWKRAESAARKVRAFLAKHLKTDPKQVKIDKSVNEKLWERGSMKPPLKVRVRAVKFEAGGVQAELAQEWPGEFKVEIKRRINITGTSVLGVFATCTEEFVFIPYDAPDETITDLENSLGVTAVRSSVGGSTIVGSLMRGNTNGVMVAGFALEKELRKLRKHTKAARLSGELNAAGNLILANDTAALVHPDLSDKTVNVIKKTLGVDVRKGTVGGLKTVGMAALATNKGVLVHPKATASEIAVLEDLFNLPVDIGTINFGSPLVGSGLLANSKGYVAGEETTGPEISRIEDALGYE